MHSKEQGWLPRCQASRLRVEMSGWEDGPPLPELQRGATSTGRRRGKPPTKGDSKREGLGMAGMARGRGNGYRRL